MQAEDSGVQLRSTKAWSMSSVVLGRPCVCLSSMSPSGADLHCSSRIGSFVGINETGSWFLRHPIENLF